MKKFISGILIIDKESAGLIGYATESAQIKVANAETEQLSVIFLLVLNTSNNIIINNTIEEIYNPTKSPTL